MPRLVSQSLLALLILPAIGHAVRCEARPPNIVVILADDLGYGDVSCYENREYTTPHLDRIAAEGVRFTRYYDACGVCSPTRAGLLTGRFPARFGITRHFSDGTEFLVPSATQPIRALREAGYENVHVGKWHLGGLKAADLTTRDRGQPGPLQHGFDHYLCMREEADPRRVMVRNRTLYHHGSAHLIRDDQPVDLSPAHLTEVEINEAVQQLERLAKRDGPFFLNVWFDVPHKPLEAATAPYLEPHAKVAGDAKLYRSMVSHFDGGAGRIVDALRRLKLAESTLVLISSDNGPTLPGSPGSLRGGKGTLFDGGLRVPFIAWWPGKISPRVSDELIATVDVMPTICELAGVPPAADDRFDGRSLVAHLLRGEPLDSRGPLFWQMDAYPNFQTERKESPPHATTAIMLDRWKLLCDGTKPLQLFDVRQDPHEKHDRSADEPRVVADLQARLQAWLAEPRTSWKEQP